MNLSCWLVLTEIFLLSLALTTSCSSKAPVTNGKNDRMLKCHKYQPSSDDNATQVEKCPIGAALCTLRLKDGVVGCADIDLAKLCAQIHRNDSIDDGCLIDCGDVSNTRCGNATKSTDIVCCCTDNLCNVSHHNRSERTSNQQQLVEAENKHGYVNTTATYDGAIPHNDNAPPVKADNSSQLKQEPTVGMKGVKIKAPTEKHTTSTKTTTTSTTTSTTKSTMTTVAKPKIITTTNSAHHSGTFTLAINMPISQPLTPRHDNNTTSNDILLPSHSADPSNQATTKSNNKCNCPVEVALAVGLPTIAALPLLFGLWWFVYRTHGKMADKNKADPIVDITVLHLKR